MVRSPTISSATVQAAAQSHGIKASGGHSLRESGKVKLRHFVVMDGRTMEELEEVKNALDSGRLSERLIQRAMLAPEDYDLCTTFSPAAAPAPDQAAATAAAPIGLVLSESGRQKVCTFVTQADAEALADLAEIEEALRGGRLGKRLIDRLRLVDDDFMRSALESPETDEQKEEQSDAAQNAAGCCLSWEEFELRVDRRCADIAALEELVVLSRASGESLSTLSRRQWQKKLFGVFDADGNGRLGSFEMESFARLTGFDGPAKEWETEFEVLCNDHGAVSHLGLDLDGFVEVTDDKGDSGCYCSTRDLSEIATQLVAKPPPSKGQSRAASSSSRTCAGDANGQQLGAPAASAPKDGPEAKRQQPHVQASAQCSQASIAKTKKNSLGKTSRRKRSHSCASSSSGGSSASPIQRRKRPIAAPQAAVTSKPLADAAAVAKLGKSAEDDCDRRAIKRRSSFGGA